MNSDATIRSALIEAADAMLCASNDFHCLHFNMHGSDFDSMHAHVLKRYYEQAADDYDELCEKAQMYSAKIEAIPNGCGAAERIKYKAFEGCCTREAAVARCDEVFSTIIGILMPIWSVLNEQQYARAVGTANWLAGRIEYWGKEQAYFNRYRGAL